MLRRLPGRKVSGQMQKRTQVMPVMGGRTGKDGKRQMGLAIAFIILGLLTSITLQIVAGTMLMEDVSECYEKIEEIARMTLDHANAVERENGKLRKETEVIAQAAAELKEENRRFREGNNGDEI